MAFDTGRPPNSGRSPEANRSVPELFTNAITQVTTLFREEVKLARAEMGEKFGEATLAIPQLGAGVAMLLGAMLLLLFAAAAGVSDLLQIAPGWGQVIVGAVVALAGWLLIRTGLSHLKASNLLPERTAEQLARDAQVAKEQIL